MIDKQFKKVLDWADKFFKRFRALGYIIAVIFLIVYFIDKGFDKREMLRVTEKITGLNMQKDLLIKEKENISEQRDSLISQNKILRAQRDSVLVLKEQEAWRSAKYKRERNEARRKLKEYTPNESYDFLDKEAYPYIGEKQYKFNAKQVTGMHETFVENEYNKSIVETQSSELEYCNEALALSKQSEIISDTVTEMAVEEMLIGEEIMAIDEEKADIAMKQWKKERRKRIWGKVEKWVFAIGGFAAGLIANK
jgi:hypothetical protein